MSSNNQMSGDPIVLRSDKNAKVGLVRVFDEVHKYEVWFDFYFDPSEGFEEHCTMKFQTLKDATRFYVSKIKKESRYRFENGTLFELYGDSYVCCYKSQAKTKQQAIREYESR